MNVNHTLETNPFSKSLFSFQVRDGREIITRTDRLKSILLQVAMDCFYEIPTYSAYLLAPQAFIAAAVNGIFVGMFYALISQFQLIGSGGYKEGVFLIGPIHRKYTKEWGDYLKQNVIHTDLGLARRLIVALSVNLILAKTIQMYPNFARTLFVPQIRGFCLGAKIGYNMTRFAHQGLFNLSKVLFPQPRAQELD